MALKIDPATLSPSGYYHLDDVGSVADGVAVGTFSDDSGNGRDLTQGTGGNQPRLRQNIFNGRPSIRFDGTNDYLSSSVNGSVLLGASGLGTIIVVARTFGINNPDSAKRGILELDSIFSTPTGLSLRLDVSPQSLEATSSPVSFDKWYIGFARKQISDDTIGNNLGPFVQNNISPYPRIIMWLHDTASAKIKLGVDNLDDAALVSSEALATNDLAYPLVLGRHLSDYWEGDIFELIIFPTALSESDRRGVCLWLTEKFKMPYESGVESVPITESPTLSVEMKLPTTELTLSPSLWLKADAITGLNDDDLVTTWLDSSGNGNNVTQSTGSLKPLYKTGILNGKPAVLFDGGDDVLSSTALLSVILGIDGLGTIYVVARANGDTPEHNHTFWSDSGGHAHLVVVDIPGGPDTLRASNLDAGGTDTVTKNYTMGDWALAVWRHSLGGGGLDESPDTLILGLGATASGYSTTPSGATTVLGNTLDVGGGANDTINGYIAEILFFPKSHNAAERRHVISYLSAKYAFTYLDDTEEYEPVWLDVTEDVRMAEPFRFKYGIFGSEIVDRVASPGELFLSLENSSENSAALEGYYSPEHTNLRSGFRIGTPVRIKMTHFGTPYCKWQGWINQISVEPGSESLASRILASDWMDSAGRVTLSRMPIRVNEDAGTLFFRLYVNSPFIPESFFLAKGTDTYAFAFDLSEDEGIPVLAEFSRLCGSELGFAYVRGNTLGGGQLTFESRGKRSLRHTVRWAMSGASAISKLELSEHSLDGIVNRVIIITHPRRVDAAPTTVLFSMQSTLEIPAGRTRDFVAPYLEPGSDVRVGGKDMVTPVATTDYTFNSEADGSGIDQTSQLEITVTFGANSAQISVTNHGSAGFITKFELRGRGLYAYQAAVVDKSDSNSVTKYGQMTARLDMKYQGNLNLAQSAAAYVLDRYSVPKTRVRSVTFFARKLSDTAMNAVAREIGDRVSITESVSGITDAEYFIQGIEISYIEDHPLVRWTLAPADQEDVWILGVPGRSELGSTTRLAFGAVT